ncbi:MULTISPECIES: DUF4231 domain-containing protein [Bradyrhizobium]|uniref:DUF4231 domain-containing protein n=2 Tax=Nitrobacteraceae TaxID=41294 RepID=A0ABS5GC49_9BRAD|nr:MULTISPECIES: DUF4231 domain-containing protein [unclassified Bradyrhizobium]MBR1138922.1 DUF4231 domain-containing protein [Bradyrhizobium denitrificans]MDU1497850.1 DUF4231 domain-containing protein [Bradyrhizobium sp.]MDU1548101.1 DUF4231 domain-containing protein [Bradyrhizobium sp.]MDU1804854.1 DUF4231 domain-containing protein [Bradyrhizobium sp.]MDU3096861.1 DUF4231 domain-containing protein [Bradyrhizobium sp.]
MSYLAGPFEGSPEATLTSMTSPFSKPSLAFRIGVTGTRQIGSAAEIAVRTQIAQLLQLISGEIGKLAKTPASQAVYLQQADGVSGWLRMVSPLAEGSDRLAAEEALKAGYSLYAPLPFLQAEYERDFPATVEAFRTLLSRADVLELDGTREFASESYRQAGRFVVRNCDLLIAVWDGASERGPGGTAEIVRFATNLKVPVWWIDPSGRSAPCFVEDAQKLRAARANDADAAQAELGRYLEGLFVPPKMAGAERPGIFGRVAHFLSRALDRDTSPLQEYLIETGPRKRRIWRAYSVAVGALIPMGRGVSSTQYSYITPTSESRRFGYFQRADGLSEAYGDRYRSSYVLIAALAIVVAVSAVGELLPHRLEILTSATGDLAMVVIAALLVVNYYYRWHERWISYRLLAELLRKQTMLWMIGRSLPTQEILRSALSCDVAEEGDRSKLSRDAWIGWYFVALTRSAPPLTGAFDTKKSNAALGTAALITEQIQYHTWRAASSRAGASRMERAGQFFVFVGAAATVVKGAFWIAHHIGVAHHIDPLLEGLKALVHFITIVSLSFVGLRTYSELPLLAQQSSRMIKILKNAEAELAAIDIGAPSSSWELGHTMNSLALAMMQDVTGWMELFRLKVLEAPDVH